MVESIIQSTHYLFSYYVNKTIVITSTDFLLKEIGDEKARTKSAPEPHIPAGPNALYTHTHASHIFSTHRAHVAFPVNVLSGRQRQRQRPRRSGVALEVAARKSRWRGGRGEWSLHAPVTATPWLSPTRLPPSPMQNHPLSRSMGNYFLSVDYGVNFRTTRPRSFRTRYDSDLRRLRERVSYGHRGELQSRICYEPLDPIIKQIIINRSKREINTFCFISFVRRLLLK